METNSEDINIIDYAKVLIKNKKTIFVFFLIGIIMAGAAIFVTPNMYHAKVVIELGSIKGTLGDVTFLRDSSQVVNEINYSFFQKYPSLNAVVVSPGLISVNNYSKNKAEAERGVSDVLATIEPADDSSKTQLQNQINKLKSDMATLRGEGQQVANIYMAISELQGKLDSFVPTKVIQQTTIFGKKMNLTLSLIIGGTLGLFLGLLFVSMREWWRKNKKEIL